LKAALSISHSSRGIMVETLRQKHFEQANKGKLLFRSEEAQRMRRAAAYRPEFHSRRP
jgi:hypothetical protein